MQTEYQQSTNRLQAAAAPQSVGTYSVGILSVLCWYSVGIWVRSVVVAGGGGWWAVVRGGDGDGGGGGGWWCCSPHVPRVSPYVLVPLPASRFLATLLHRRNGAGPYPIGRAHV